MTGASTGKAVLISPRTGSLTVSPPLHLGYLAAVLRAEGWQVSIYDFSLPAAGANMKSALREIAAARPDFIGITSKTIEFENAKSIIKNLSTKLPDTKFVMGGVHATALPERTLRETGCDFLVMGEGEKTIVELARGIRSGGAPRAISGIAFMDSGEFVRTPPRELEQDLDSIPFPAWDLMPPERYSATPWQIFSRRSVVAPIMTTRGCPFRCSFCAQVVHGRKIRRRSPGNVADEMELLVRDYGVREFQVIDDNFNTNREHAAAVCEEIIARDLGIVWKTPNGIRADFLDDELAALMKRSGCYQVGFGVESADPEILERCGKKLDLDAVRRAAAVAHRHGLEVYGFFIIGMPGETRATVEETIRFMRGGFDFINVSFCNPYPGSALFDEYFSNEPGEIDWNRFVHYNTFNLCDLSENEMKRYFRKAVFGFYANPARAAGLAKYVLSPGRLKSTVRLLSKYMASG